MQVVALQVTLWSSVGWGVCFGPFGGPPPPSPGGLLGTDGDGAGVKWDDPPVPPVPAEPAPTPRCATAPPPKRSPPRPPTPGLPLRRAATADAGVPVCRTARTTGAAGAG